jgi:hypothetical protein
MGSRTARRVHFEPFDTAWPEVASGVCQLAGCGKEGTERRPLLPCDACGMGVHRDCAGFSRKAYGWNRGYLCDVCRVTRLDRHTDLRTDLQGVSRWDRDRRRSLMRAANVIRSRSWADSTWGATCYHLQRVMQFERDSGIAVVPLSTESMMIYFTWLIETTPTWRAVRQARTAIRAWHIVAKLPDPFIDDPERLEYLQGLKRTVTLFTRKKLAMPLRFVTTMLTKLFEDPLCTHELALRDASWLILGFFGFRRHSEVVYRPGADEPGGQTGVGMGLRMKDVEFFPEERRIRVFIRRMKNDPHGRGHHIWLCDSTASGVPIYSILRRYADTLGLAPDSEEAFLRGRRTAGGSWGPRLTNYRSRLKTIMRRYLDLTEEELADYSAHSLRRGGVTHAYRQDVHWDLLNVHGSWLGGSAIVGYRWPSDEQLVSVTERM